MNELGADRFFNIRVFVDKEIKMDVVYCNEVKLRNYLKKAEIGIIEIVEIGV
jgi:hypothetical protein